MGIREALEELKARRQSALQMGGAEALRQQHAKGRLSARERLDLLVEPKTFIERGMLARCQDPALAESTAADGLITGFGDVAGTTAAIIAEDATVLDNTDGQVAILKRMRLLSLTAHTGWPLICLFDRGRGEVKEVQEALLMGRAAPQRPEPELVSLSGVKVAVVMGSCFGHSSSLAAQADLLVMVKGSSLSLLGPGLDARQREQTEDWRLHSEVTGLVDRVAEDDREALTIVRDFLSYVPPCATLEPRRLETKDVPERSVELLLRVVPEDPEQGYDMAEVIACLVDERQVFQFKPTFGRSVITCLARLDGYSVGIAASQPLHHRGALDADAVAKVQRLVELCDRYHLPLVFLQDTPGYLAQSDQEHRDILARTTRLANTIKAAQVPRLAIILRQGFAMGEFVLGGRKLGMDYVAAWPVAEVGAKEPVTLAQPPGGTATTRAGPWYAAGLAFLDDIIEPQDTRRALVKTLQVVRRSLQVPPLQRF